MIILIRSVVYTEIEIIYIQTVIYGLVNYAIYYNPVIYIFI